MSATPIADLIAELVSQGLSLESALKAARIVEEKSAAVATSRGLDEIKRQYERDRKAAYRARKSGTIVPDGLRERESSIPIDSEIKGRKKDSLVPPVRDNGDKSDWPKDYREQFWQSYPRRVEKAAAMRKLEAIRRGGAVPWAEFFGGVTRYANQCAGKEQRYVKHPTTWLNRGCWSDEPERRGQDGNLGTGGGENIGFAGLGAAIRARRFASAVDAGAGAPGDVRAGGRQDAPELDLVRLEDRREDSEDTAPPDLRRA